MYSHLWLIPCPWVWVEPCGLASSEQNVAKAMGCHFYDQITKRLSYFCLAGIFCFSFAGLDEANCYVVSCSMERFTWQRIEGVLWPTTSEELRFLNQQPTRNWNLSIATRMSLEEDPLPVKLWDNCSPCQCLECRLWETLSQRYLAKPYLVSWTIETER